MVSLLYAGIFRSQAVRKLFGIPPVVKHADLPKRKSAWREVVANYRSNKTIPPSLNQLKNQDADRFKKAGRGKPIIK